MLKHLILDFDGTIANTLPVWLKLYKQTLHEFNIKASKDQIVDNCFGQKSGVINLGITLDQKDDFYSKLLSRRNDIYSAELFKGFSEVVTRLTTDGFKFSIATASAKDSVVGYLKDKDLLQYFDIVVGGYEVDKLKPHPEVIYLIMNYYNNTKTSDYIIVGDSAKDVKAGINAGIKTAFFYPPESKPFNNKQKILSLHPNVVFSSWGDFYTNIISLQDGK